jgi:hypothetical protein
MADARSPLPPPAAPPAALSPAITAPGVTIDRLHLRLPAQGAASGRRVVERALALAARRLPPGLAGQLPQLALRVQPRSFTESGLSEAIAEALLEALRKRGTEERHA